MTAPVSKTTQCVETDTLCPFHDYAIPLVQIYAI